MPSGRSTTRRWAYGVAVVALILGLIYAALPYVLVWALSGVRFTG